MTTTPFRYPVLALAAFCLVACSGSTRYMVETQEILQPNKDYAVVTFMRPYKFVGGGRDLAVMDGSTAIGNLPVGTQFQYLTPPGKHFFFAGASGIANGSVSADLAPEKTYYVVVALGMGGTAMQAAKKGSPLWDRALDYERSLRKLAPNKELLGQWSEAHKGELEARAGNMQNMVMSGDQTSALAPEDGR